MNSSATFHKLSPTPEEIEALGRVIPTGPVVIVNLLKFHPGPAAREAYLRYMQDARPASSPKVQILHAGPAFSDVGGGSDWDYVIIARYPSYQDFAGTVLHPAYQGPAAAHRPDALARTVMLVSQPGDLAADFALGSAG